MFPFTFAVREVHCALYVQCMVVTYLFYIYFVRTLCFDRVYIVFKNAFKKITKLKNFLNT